MTEPSALSLPDDVRLLNLSEDSLSTPLKKPQAGGVGNTRSSYCYGSITSQYATIPSSASTLVEVASLYAQVRAFSQCQAAFESIDPHLRSHPVVAYEQFLAYWAQWRLLDSAKTLEDALTQAQERGANTHEYGVYTLLRISLGKAEVFTKGNFTRARDSMREVRSWLRDVLFDTYTDVQVSLKSCASLTSDLGIDIESDRLSQPLLLPDLGCKPCDGQFRSSKLPQHTFRPR